MVDTDRKLIWVHVEYFDHWSFDGNTPAEVAQKMVEVTEKHLHKPFQRLKIDCGLEEGYDGWEYYFYIMGERLENDQEFAERIEKEAEAEEWAERHERDTFKRLKKKYGG